MSIEWGEIFGLSVSPLELIVRGTAMYLFLFLLFRVVILRRNLRDDTVSVIKR
jgi:hypothetical protein